MIFSTEAKASVGVGGVVHGQHDAGQDLRDQHDRQDAAEGPGIVEVARHRIGDEDVVDQPRQRQAARRTSVSKPVFGV